MFVHSTVRIYHNENNDGTSNSNIRNSDGDNICDVVFDVVFQNMMNISNDVKLQSYTGHALYDYTYTQRFVLHLEVVWRHRELSHQKPMPGPIDPPFGISPIVSDQLTSRPPKNHTKQQKNQRIR